MNGSRCVRACPGCGTCFTEADLLTSELIEPVGLQPDIENPHHPYVVYVHRAAGCGSSFLVPIGTLMTMVYGAAESARALNEVDCASCLTSEELSTCRRPCTCSVFRDLMTRLRTRSEAVGQSARAPASAASGAYTKPGFEGAE